MEIDLRTAKEIRSFLRLDKAGFGRFVKHNNITKFPLNTRISRYNFNEVMQVLENNRLRMMEAQKAREAMKNEIDNGFDIEAGTEACDEPGMKVGNRIHVTLFCDEVRELMREKLSVFAVWYALNALAFQRGNPFNASKRELERMLQIDQKTIHEAEKRLQSLGFVSVVSGAKSGKRNGYEMKKGAYMKM